MEKGTERGIMEKGTEIDLWFGIGDGQSQKVNAKYIGLSISPDRIDAQVIDPDFLEYIDWEKEDGDYIVNAYNIGEDHWVKYDDFAWSLKGEINDDELVPNNESDSENTFKFLKIINEYTKLLGK
jgi:hypothetical protein